MSGISYFQKYVQRENHLTNNTLLMLRHIYRSSPSRMKQALYGLLGDEGLEVGPTFEQQKRASHSVPDAVIDQKPFHIYIEAKHGGELHETQLESHIQSIAAMKHAKGTAFLIGLTGFAQDNARFDELEQFAGRESIGFMVTTFSELLATLDKACRGDTELLEILEDYRALIAGEGLLPRQYCTMVVFPCGTSLTENIKYGLYYEPESRNPKWTQAHILGIYNDKTISYVGKIQTVAICRRSKLKGLEVLSNEYGDVSESQKDRINGAIDDAASYYPEFAEEPYRFYLTDRIVETEVHKITHGGMMGHRYFDIPEQFGIKVEKGADIESIAELLRGKAIE